MHGFSVIMPTYNQASFIRRAIFSLQRQTYTKWELIIINDGSTDETEFFIADFLDSPKITYIKNEENMGLGYAINQGLDIAKYEFIAYLPSDDFYYENHLEVLNSKLNESDKIILVFSGVRFDESDKVGLIRMRNAFGVRPEYNLLLIQAAHRKTADRWIERKECVSDDLFYTFWKKMTGKGEFAATHKITCEWCNHPNQRHKITGERFRGGLNKYREYYKVKHPIRIRTTNYKIIDENEQYAPFRKKHIVPEEHLKILLVGDLAYNAERIYAFEEAGHKLYGLWSLPAFCYSTVGPLPFGNVENISYENWRNQIKEINPDIIYAQLSSGAIKIAHEVMEAKTGIPFVWHFKEGPHEAMKWGLWDKLIDLYTYADGKIYLNDNIKEWYEIFTPSHSKYQHTYILDPELPKSNCFGNNFSEKISTRNENEIHTVVIGRIIGISPQEMFILAAYNIHIHVYNQNYVSEERTLAKYRQAAPNHFHVHSYCHQDDWVAEFSKYDAGWLHAFNSTNGGSLIKAGWADLNIPARIATLVAAGLPIIQKKNAGHKVAMRDYMEKFKMGVFYTDIRDLLVQLKNKSLLKQIEVNVVKNRMRFTYDYHTPYIIEFFKKVIDTNKRVKS